MRQRRSFLTFTLALLFCLSLAACGAKQYPMEITVVNRTTYPIADIRISLTSEEDWGEMLMMTSATILATTTSYSPPNSSRICARTG